MPTIRLETSIRVPIDLCFNLARTIDLHCEAVAHTRERAIAGVTTGMIGHGESVTWEAIHFGIKQRLTVHITAFEQPHRFVDEMTSGTFRTMKHTHLFQEHEGGTLMTDIFEFSSPCGWLGKIVDALVLERYMRNFLSQKNRYFKQAAEQIYAQQEREGSALIADPLRGAWQPDQP